MPIEERCRKCEQKHLPGKRCQKPESKPYVVQTKQLPGMDAEFLRGWAGL